MLYRTIAKLFSQRFLCAASWVFCLLMDLNATNSMCECKAIIEMINLMGAWRSLVTLSRWSPMPFIYYHKGFIRSMNGIIQSEVFWFVEIVNLSWEKSIEYSFLMTKMNFMNSHLRAARKLNRFKDDKYSMLNHMKSASAKSDMRYTKHQPSRQSH